MAIAVWLAVARAQDVVLEDFDGVAPAMDVYIGYASVSTPPTAHDGQALEIEPIVSPYEGHGLVRLLEPHLMTHTRIRIDALADDRFPGRAELGVWPTEDPPDWPYMLLDLVDWDWASGEGDVSVVCGFEAALDLAGMTGNPYQMGYFETADTGVVWVEFPVAYWIDNITLTGAICDVFLDPDGDGACPQGVDLDGNGDCIGPGEPSPRTPPDTGGPATADTGGPPAETAETADTAVGGATGGTGAPPVEDTGPPSATGDTAPDETTADTAAPDDTGASPTHTGATPTDTAATPPDTSSGTTPPPTDGGFTPDRDDTGDSGAAGKGCGCAGSGSKGAGAGPIVLAIAVLRRLRAGPRRGR